MKINAILSSIDNRTKTNIIDYGWEYFENKPDIRMWRWVCMPEVIIHESSEQRLNFNTVRYNTLEIALKFDYKLIDLLNSNGYKANISLYINDYEIYFLRQKETFDSFSEEVRNKILEDTQIKEKTKKWVLKNIKKSYIKFFKIVFFSDFLSHNYFTERLGVRLNDINKNLYVYEGILEKEIEYIIKAKDLKRSNLVIEKAKIRVAQYSLETDLLIEYQGIDQHLYLNSEYPTEQVFKKMTIFRNIPSLFYMKDSDVKNI